MLKRLICLFISLIMLFSVACDNESNVTEDSSQVSEEQSKEDVSAPTESKPDEDSKPNEESNPDVEINGKEYAELIDSLLTDTANRKMNCKNTVFGKSYKTSIAAHNDYPDGKKLLTDGTKPTAFSSDGIWVGYVFNSADEVNVIDFDLGKVTDGLMDFSVRSLSLVEYAINAPESITVYLAGEDKEYVKVGVAHVPGGKIGENQPIDYSVYLQGAVSARYIRFEIAAAKKGWCFIGEITAMAYSDKFDEYSSLGSSLNDYYGYEGIPVITEEKYWDKQDDYDEIQNLLLKKKAMISASEYVQNDLVTNWYNTKSGIFLTDGTIATESSINDNRWYHITRGGSRVITVDMERISAVSGFSAGFLYEDSSGVQYPSDVTVKLSLDGVNWQTVFSHEGHTATEESEIFRYDEDFGKEYKARYFQLSFTVNTHTYIDDISVKARKNAEDALELVADKEQEEDDQKIYDGYAMPEDLYGVNNMLLSYHCYTDASGKSTENGLITEEEYLPYVAYLDKDGNIKDTFFDAYLYLPYVRHIHGEGSNFGRSADGWRAYVDDMFFEDRNMDALNSCAEKVYNQLGITDQKLKVFTSILYTFPTTYGGSKNNFGDIDGDGVDEDFANIEDRKAAIKWIMDEEYNRFKEKGYENLEFCGFYWFEEGITYSDPHEVDLIAFAVDYAHKLGVKIFWIPYNGAPGIKDWEKLGFDVACLQPNYMFNQVPADVLYETAKTASSLGMCVEIEFNDPNNKLEANKYIEYLIAGAKSGYMDAIKMYYQSGVPGAFHTACYSHKPDVRSLYDDTYLFAKGEFDPIWPEDVIISEAPLEFKLTKDGETQGSIDISEFSDVSGNLVVTLSPKYGSVKLSNDGSFVYYPVAGYEGGDSFAIAFDLGYGEPISTTIILTEE